MASLDQCNTFGEFASLISSDRTPTNDKETYAKQGCFGGKYVVFAKNQQTVSFDTLITKFQSLAQKQTTPTKTDNEQRTTVIKSLSALNDQASKSTNCLFRIISAIVNLIRAIFCCKKKDHLAEILKNEKKRLETSTIITPAFLKTFCKTIDTSPLQESVYQPLGLALEKLLKTNCPTQETPPVMRDINVYIATAIQDVYVPDDDGTEINWDKLDRAVLRQPSLKSSSDALVILLVPFEKDIRDKRQAISFKNVIPLVYDKKTNLVDSNHPVNKVRFDEIAKHLQKSVVTPTPAPTTPAVTTAPATPVVVPVTIAPATVPIVTPAPAPTTTPAPSPAPVTTVAAPVTLSPVVPSVAPSNPVATQLLLIPPSPSKITLEFVRTFCSISSNSHSNCPVGEQSVYQGLVSALIEATPKLSELPITGNNKVLIYHTNATSSSQVQWDLVNQEAETTFPKGSKVVVVMLSSAEPRVALQPPPGQYLYISKTTTLFHTASKPVDFNEMLHKRRIKELATFVLGPTPTPTAAPSAPVPPPTPAPVPVVNVRPTPPNRLPPPTPGTQVTASGPVLPTSTVAPSKPLPAAPPAIPVGPASRTISSANSYEYMEKFFSCRDKEIKQALDIQLESLIEAHPDSRANLGSVKAYCFDVRGVRMDLPVIKDEASKWANSIVPPAPLASNQALPPPVVNAILVANSYNHEKQAVTSTKVTLYSSLSSGYDSKELMNRVGIQQLAELLLGLPVTPKSVLLKKMRDETIS